MVICKVLFLPFEIASLHDLSNAIPLTGSFLTGSLGERRDEWWCRYVLPLSRDEVGGKRDIGIVCSASPNVARDSQTQSIFFELFLESYLSSFVLAVNN